MKQINVIDFDKTLIPFDSFRVYVKKGIKKLNVKVIFYTVIRIFKIITNETFKKKIIKLDVLNTPELKSFEDFLLNSINLKILDKIKQQTTDNTINILCSASPNFYISNIASKLNMIGYGSRFINENDFIHMYGNNKIKFILDHYPKEKYHYNFAVSDSSSDQKLLSLFEESELID